MSDLNTLSESMPSFIDVLWDQLTGAIGYRAESRLTAFIRQRNVKKWIIATDFCIKDNNRPIDAFAFVIMPAAENFIETRELVRGIPRDLKKVSVIPNQLKRLLLKGKVFTLAFAADPARRLYATPEIARHNLDETIAMMERWENADANRDLINAVRRMRIEASKKNLNLKLMEDIVITAAIVAFIAFLLCKHGKAEMIAWAPDRDKITEAYQGIATTMFHINLSALCHNNNLYHPTISIFTQTNEDLWLDPFIRVADYVAGAVAAWDPPDNPFVPPKIADIIRNVFADNRYLFVFRLAYYCSEENSTCDLHGVSMSRKPPGPHQQGRKAFFQNIKALRGRSKTLK